MNKNEPANEPAKKSKNPAYYLTPPLPGNSNIGPLKDMAQEIIAASAGLEGKVAGETAIVLGDQLRLINSYYSNLIEGHKTTIPDISMALQKKFSKDPEKHLYTHTPKGFSRAPVNPGQIRDVNVSVDGRSLHGPDYQDLPALLKTFAQSYTPDQFHGDERLIAMAASHHRLTWLHPFRDGNDSSNWGRVLRPRLD